MKYPPTVIIEAKTLPEAYGKLIHTCMRDGMTIKTQYGPPSKDMCAVVEITHPFVLPMLHPDFPTKDMHLAEYIKQWERSYDWKKQGFEYTYVDRLTHYPCTPNYADVKLKEYYSQCLINFMDSGLIDQLAALRYQLSTGVTSRRFQMITWIPDRDLFVKEDQPCLQRLWLRILNQGEVELHTEWRSRDLYAAWNSNVIGLLTMIKKELLEPNNLKLVKYVEFINAAHIYETDWQDAEKVHQYASNPQL
jgi:thymidylate synthase